MTGPVAAWHKRLSEDELAKVTIDPDCPRCGSDQQSHIGSYIEGYSRKNVIETVYFTCKECGHTHKAHELVCDRM